MNYKSKTIKGVTGTIRVGGKDIAYVASDLHVLPEVQANNSTHDTQTEISNYELSFEREIKAEHVIVSVARGMGKTKALYDLLDPGNLRHLLFGEVEGVREEVRETDLLAKIRKLPATEKDK